MEWARLVDAFVYCLDVALLAFLAYGAYLALGGRRRVEREARGPTARGLGMGPEH